METLGSMFAVSSPPFPNVREWRVSLQLKGGITLKPLTSEGQIERFPREHPLHHIYPSVHLSIQEAFSPGLRWNRIWLVEIFSLTIHDLWETPPPPLPPLPPLSTSSSVFNASPLTLTCSTFSSSCYFPLYKSSTFFSLNRLPARWCLLPA